MKTKTKNEAYKSVFLSPFSYLKPSVWTEACVLSFLLLLQVFLLIATKSFSSLIVIFSALLASFASDILYEKQNYKKSFEILSSLIRGLFIGLLLPETFPPVAVFFVAFSVLFVNRYIFGGFGNSWINPIAVTVAVCWLIGMKFFPEVSVSISSLQSKNPALSLIQNGIFPKNEFDLPITNWLNKRLFSFLGVSIPEGYVSLFWDSHSAIPAFRFNLLTLVSSIVLLSTDILSPIIPAVFTIVYASLVKIFAPFFYGGFLFNGDIILALLSSGTLFCTFFLLSWHGTTPYTNRGKWFYAIFAGILAFFVLGVGLSPSGFAFTILIVNVFSLFVQNVENHYLRNFTSTDLIEQVKAVKEGNNA